MSIFAHLTRNIYRKFLKLGAQIRQRMEEKAKSLKKACYELDTDYPSLFSMVNGARFIKKDGVELVTLDMVKDHDGEYSDWTITIEQGQKIGEVMDRIPFGVLNKTITGLGATTLEITNQERDSIIVVPTKSLAYGKYKCTMRCKQDYVLNEKNGKMIPEKVGLKAVMRDGIDYEFTIVFDINMKHQAIASKDRTNLFMGKPDFTITPTTGQIILDWCNDGVTVEMIRQQINTAKTIEELTAIYHKYPEWYQQLTSGFMQKKMQLQEEQNKPSINYNPNFIRYGSNAATASQG